jgi:salicylate 5-hydroxylase large subunit
MLAPARLASRVDWPSDQTSRVPYSLYTDSEIYQRELERLFYRGHWCYAALDAEIPNGGDFKRTRIGERDVIVVRDRHGAIQAVENRCAHRGVQFCQKGDGNTKTFVCPYHQWSYDLSGSLIGVPFRKGFRQSDDRLVGGMPADFDLADFNLTKLKVESYEGLIFVSFDHDIEPFADFVGSDIRAYIDRIFKGRKLKVLGYSRQRIPGNWKLMMENIKDPYHPGLLHSWFVVFGLWRADQDSKLVVDSRGRHAAMVSAKNDGGKGEATVGITSFKEHMKLHDDRVLDVVVEPWWQGPTVTMLTLFPSVIIQQQVNSLSMRHIQPAGPNAFDFVWTQFGFEDDSSEMTRRRLRQANLFGPAGYVSADDGEVIEFSQRGFTQHNDMETVCELGGRSIGGCDHNVSETLIRSMYAYYREAMEL